MPNSNGNPQWPSARDLVTGGALQWLVSAAELLLLLLVVVGGWRGDLVAPSAASAPLLPLLLLLAGHFRESAQILRRLAHLKH